MSRSLAICGEATSLGLRTVVHAISAQSVRAATLGGCTEIEHGTFVTDAELKLMAEHGTIVDPQVCLVFQNYSIIRDVFKLFSCAAINPLKARFRGHRDVQARDSRRRG